MIWKPNLGLSIIPSWLVWTQIQEEEKGKKVYINCAFSSDHLKASSTIMSEKYNVIQWSVTFLPYMNDA